MPSWADRRTIRDRQIDEEMWNSGLALVVAYNDYRQTTKGHDTFAKESRESWKRLEYAEKRYKKAVLAGRERPAKLR